jgi:integrase
MGRRPGINEGVAAKASRIEVRFTYRGKDIRPTLDLVPTSANIKYAIRLRKKILAEIDDHTFVLGKHFPDYKFTGSATTNTNSFGLLLPVFLQWIATRQAHSSVLSLKRKLTSFWLPHLEHENVRAVSFKQLSVIVSARHWNKPKTHNNYVSALREFFSYIVDHEYAEENPTLKLKMLVVQAAEHQPYSVVEALALISKAREKYGEIDALYWQFAFLEGMRPGEQISLKWADLNRITGKLTVSRMRTEGEDKASTKTGVVRHISLTEASIALITNLRPLTQLRSEFMFVDYLTGLQIDRSTIMQERWQTLHKLTGVSYRSPYECRHTSVSWKLMMDRPIFKVAKNHGHSVATMLKTYAHWIESDCDATELALITEFHSNPSQLLKTQNE